MVVRRELLRGLERLNATTTVLQRARLADPLGGMWEAADVQWWWRRPRATDELALPVWFDEVGPVAAAGLTAWDDTWQADVFAVPSIVDEEDVWAATLEATAGHRGEALQVLVREDDAPLADLAIQSGFAMTDELSGTTWMDADQRPPVAQVDGFAIVDRVTRADRPHPMIARNGELVEPRLRQCSLYDPTLDLAVEDADGRVAGYALFWFDHTTLVGLLEPMRVEDEYQRRGLARMLLTNGLDRLARKGARRLKVGFETDAARNLYLGAGFVQTSVDRLLIRPAPHEPSRAVTLPVRRIPLALSLPGAGQGGRRPLELLPRVIGAPNERSRLDVRDAEGLTDTLVVGELIGRHPAIHREVERRGLQVLADRHEVASGVAEVGQRVCHLRRLFSPIPRMRFDFVICPGAQALGHPHHARVSGRTRTPDGCGRADAGRFPGCARTRQARHRSPSRCHVHRP